MLPSSWRHLAPTLIRMANADGRPAVKSTSGETSSRRTGTPIPCTPLQRLGHHDDWRRSSPQVIKGRLRVPSDRDFPMAKRAQPVDRLPKAPLAEVVFELRWRLPGPEDALGLMKSDPGLLPLMDTFTASMKKIGFGSYKDMSPPLQTAGYSIARRYFKGADRPFPIMQIGHGIFASNESSLYEWKSFKTQVLLGVRTLLKDYPRLGVFKIEPNYLELRYIDAFDKSLLGKAALFDFIERGTTMTVQFPKLLTDTTLFSGDANGRFLIVRTLKQRKSSQFLMDLGTGKKEGVEDIIRLETKVKTDGAGVPTLKTPAKFFREVDEWLEFAHGITSPFFKDFLVRDVMQKFQGN